MDILTDQQDLISQSALLKHRQAILAGGTLQEYVPVSAVLNAPLIDAGEILCCSDCSSFRPDDVPVEPGECQRGFCLCWHSETDNDQWCSRAKPKNE